LGREAGLGVMVLSEFSDSTLNPTYNCRKPSTNTRMLVFTIRVFVSYSWMVDVLRSWQSGEVGLGIRIAESGNEWGILSLK
jgi:hypothetical protein